MPGDADMPSNRASASSGPSASSASSASSEPAPSASSSGNVAMPPVVNLQIVSPSFQVPIFLRSLPPAMTVKDVKEKIRETWDESPDPERQRLIYRGRMLARDAETLMDVFGEETLRTSDQQTFHLVLKPPGTVSSPIPPPPVNPLLDPNSPAAIPRPFELANIVPPTHPLATGPRRLEQPPNTNAYGYQQQQINTLQNQTDLQHRLMLQRLQVQHDQLTEQLNNLLAQDQRLRAIEAATNRFQVPAGTLYNATGNATYAQQYTNTVGGQQFALPAFQNRLSPHQQQQVLAQMQQQHQARGPSSQLAPEPNPSLLAQNVPQVTAQHGHPNRLPDHTTTITRHGTNSNGDRWQITVNESTTVIPPGNSYPPQVLTGPGNETAATLQHLLQTARMNLPRPVGTPPPGFTVPSAPQRPSSTPPIGRTPQQASLNNIPNPSRMAMAGPSFTTPSIESPTVYLMSSPNGPHALLVHNSQTFYSGNPYIANQLTGSRLAGLVGEARNRRDRTHRHRHRTRESNPAAAAVDGAGAAPQGPPQAAPNAQPVAHGPRGAIWPHVWLIVRLLIFVWFFTSGGGNSWSRLCLIWGIALSLFLANTGVFNEVFGAFWNPIRQHLENLLPLAGPNAPPAAGRGRAAQAAGNAAPATPAELNPEEVARRLLTQRRREDASWLMTQFRRVEHAVLLFVASIVPGTAERHIEARTIEENRVLEQRRQERAAAAAAAAAATAAALDAEAVANPETEAASDMSTGAPPAVVDGDGQASVPVPAEAQAVAL